MKILCLHGMLTSGAIFEFQTAAFRNLLGDDYEYVFIDGEVEVDDPSPSSSSSTAQFRWTRNTGPPEIRSAHNYIDTVIEEDGPFAGIMGFSDGAAIAASILLHHEINKSDKPPPFQFAILFSCPLVSSPDPYFAKPFYDTTYKLSSTKMFKELDVSIKDFPDQSGEAGPSEVVSASTTIKESAVDSVRRELWLATLATQTELRKLIGSEESKVLVQDLDSLPRIYHPALLCERVVIPTAFISGKHDSFGSAVQIPSELFRKENTRYVEHSGGHHLPKETIHLKNAVAAAQWAIRQSQLRANQH